MSLAVSHNVYKTEEIASLSYKRYKTPVELNLAMIKECRVSEKILDLIDSNGQILSFATKFCILTLKRDAIAC